VVVEWIAHESTPEIVTKFLEAFGHPVRYVVIPRDFATGVPLGYAFAEYENASQAQEVVKTSKQQCGSKYYHNGTIRIVSKVSFDQKTARRQQQWHASLEKGHVPVERVALSGRIPRAAEHPLPLVQDQNTAVEDQNTGGETAPEETKALKKLQKKYWQIKKAEVCERCGVLNADQIRKLSRLSQVVAEIQSLDPTWVLPPTGKVWEQEVLLEYSKKQEGKGRNVVTEGEPRPDTGPPTISNVVGDDQRVRESSRDHVWAEVVSSNKASATRPPEDDTNVEDNIPQSDQRDETALVVDTADDELLPTPQLNYAAAVKKEAKQLPVEANSETIKLLHGRRMSVDPSELNVPLQSGAAIHWNLYYDDRSGKGAQTIDYEASLTRIGCFRDMAEMSAQWNTFLEQRAASGLSSDFRYQANFRLFREGIKPTWEHEANRHGGKFVISMPKHRSMAMWQTVVQALIGQTLPGPHQVCGAVLSFRTSQDMLTVWNKDADDQSHVDAMKQSLRDLLKVETTEYFVHQWSLTKSKRDTIVQGEKQSAVSPRPREKPKEKMAPNRGILNVDSEIEWRAKKELKPRLRPPPPGALLAKAGTKNARHNEVKNLAPRPGKKVVACPTPQENAGLAMCMWGAAFVALTAAISMCIWGVLTAVAGP